MGVALLAGCHASAATDAALGVYEVFLRQYSSPLAVLCRAGGYGLCRARADGLAVGGAVYQAHGQEDRARRVAASKLCLTLGESMTIIFGPSLYSCASVRTVSSPSSAWIVTTPAALWSLREPPSSKAKRTTVTGPYWSSVDLLVSGPLRRGLSTQVAQRLGHIEHILGGAESFSGAFSQPFFVGCVAHGLTSVMFVIRDTWYVRRFDLRSETYDLRLVSSGELLAGAGSGQGHFAHGVYCEGAACGGALYLYGAYLVFGYAADRVVGADGEHGWPPACRPSGRG